MNQNLVRYLKKYNLIPYYTEVSLFLILLSFILIYITQESLRYFISKWVIGDNIFVLIIALFGVMGILIFTFDTKNRITKQAKQMIILFVIGIEIISCVLLFSYNFISGSGVSIVVAIFNLLQAIMLYYLFKYKIINEENISSEQAKYSEIIIGSIFIMILFAVTTYYFKLAWQVVFGILISYSVSFNEWITSKFGRKVIKRL